MAGGGYGPTPPTLFRHSRASCVSENLRLLYGRNVTYEPTHPETHQKEHEMFYGTPLPGGWSTLDPTSKGTQVPQYDKAGSSDLDCTLLNRVCSGY
jgi:hypothetical protein